MSIAMIRHGLCGLVSGACFAGRSAKGHLCGQGRRQIEACAGAKSRFSSLGLDKWWLPISKAGRLDFSPRPHRAVDEPTSSVFIAVGTASAEVADGHADLEHVYAAGARIRGGTRGIHRVAQVDRADRPGDDVGG